MPFLNKLRRSETFKIFLFYLFRIFPLKKHKIIFCNFSGKWAGDSPRCISDLLYKNNPDWDIVWLAHPQYNPELPHYARRVSFGMHSLKMIYELATAKVWVDSHTKFAFTRKRKNQFYMETWHGGIGLKKVEGDAIQSLDKEYIRRVKNNSAMADLFLSNSNWCSALYRRAFWYKGKILEYGYPRSDILVNKLDSTKVHAYFNIEKTTKILLYAPTFRANENVESFKLNTEDLLQVLKQKTNEEWLILVRLHPMSMLSEPPIQFTEKVLNATKYPDMQELLCESDFLITDYSSCLFDFAILQKPAFIFAMDIQEYKADRNFYFDLEQLPFPFSTNNKELMQNISHFNKDLFLNDLNQFMQSLDLKETGKATEYAVSQIEDWVKN